MTQWLARSEGRFIDLIFNCNWALVDLYKKTKSPILNKDILKHALTKYDLGIRFDQEWDWIKTRADGRYKREMCYILECLGLALGPSLNNLIIDSYSDFFKEDNKKSISAFATGKKQNVYIPTKKGFELSKTKFPYNDWHKIIVNQILSYGYFIRYLDVIKEIQDSKGTVNLIDIQNKIGPIGTTIIGGGPQFIQSTFKEWGYYLDIFDIKTRTGNSLECDLSDKIKKLKKRMMGWKTKINPLYNVKRNLEFIFKRDLVQPLRIPQFIRLELNWKWLKDFNGALETSSRRALIILYLNKNKECSFKDLEDFLYKKTKNNTKRDDLNNDLDYISCTGMNFIINKDHIKSIREIDVDDFEYYLPKGGFFKI